MKTHLLRTSRRAACGLKEPRRSTTEVREVTCAACARTFYMADREVAQQREKRK